MENVTRTLVLKFNTDGDKTHTINVAFPKEDLSLETVTEQMEKIIDSNAVLTSKGEGLTSVNSAYYKIVTIEPLEPAEGE